MREDNTSTNREDTNFGWITVYITGKVDFRDEVRKRLESSDVNFMPGNIGATSDMDTHDLYWLDEKVDLRKFKRAIGSKLILKYRLNFYNSLETFVEAQNKKREVEQTPEESLLFLKTMEI